MKNSLQDLHEVPEHLRSARKRHKCRAHGQFLVIPVKKNLCPSVVSVGKFRV